MECASVGGMIAERYGVGSSHRVLLSYERAKCIAFDISALLFTLSRSSTPVAGAPCDKR